MEFRETLLAAQRNQQQKSSQGSYYKARFDPPKKEQQNKPKDKLSANIQKFLARKDEEEKQKKLEEKQKREKLLGMRDEKALRKIQKTLKVIKSANKSVLEDAVDHDHTAVTREGPEQPDQDDYGYESQEAAAIYQKFMEKYSKVPDEPKFSVTRVNTLKKDLNGTVSNRVVEPTPLKKRRKVNTETEDNLSSKYEPDKKRETEKKTEKSKVRKPVPPPMDFNQLLKLAEQKKTEPIEVGVKKVAAEPEPDRLMTKKQRREYEEEMARRQRRQERLDAEKTGGKKVIKEERPPEKERKPEGGLGRIPKIGDKVNNNYKIEAPKPVERDRIDRDRVDRDKLQKERDRSKYEREREERLEKLKAEKDKIEKDIETERLQKLKAQRDKIERDIEKLNKDRDRLEKAKAKLESSKVYDRVDKDKQEVKKNIDLKSQNTYRIDKNVSDRKSSFTSKSSSSSGISHNKHLNSQGKSMPKMSREQELLLKKAMVAKQKSLNDGSPPLNGLAKDENGKRPEMNKSMKRVDDRKMPAGPSQAKVTNSFDFDKHVNSLGKNGEKQFPPRAVKRKSHPDDAKTKKRRVVHSDSEYDSEMDDFIDDGDENIDYSRHIKEIFGYDKSKYRYMDDNDDRTMESSFARQQREEFISKKIGIMEDLEDMRMEAMQKKKSKKGRRISDD